MRSLWAASSRTPASPSTDFANFCEVSEDAQRATTGPAIVRPGTAKGFVFLSMEDETGMMNAIVNPATFDRFKFAALPEGAPAEVHNFK